MFQRGGWLKGRLASAGHLEEVLLQLRDIAGLAHVIGTPVWAGRMTPAIRTYLARFKADLPRVAFFVTSGDTSASKVVVPMEAILGHKAEAFVGFDARELVDQRIRSSRIATFVQAIRQPGPVQDTPVAATVC